MPVNRQQNDWTQRQLFNPNTLVLRSVDGNNITVNARDGRPADEIVLLPIAGTVVAFIQAGATVSQQLTTGDQTINFDTSSDAKNVTKVGATFTLLVPCRALLYVWFHIQQQQNSNVARFWVTKNGTAQPYFGTTVETKAQGDVLATSDQSFLHLLAGDALTVHGSTSVVNGASLSAVVAAAPAPAVAAATLSLVGYLE